MNQDQIAAAQAEIRATFAANIAELEAALAEGIHGEIYVWPQHWLGAQVIVGGKSQACRVDRATIFRAGRTATFTNGKGEKAIRMDRAEALRGAIADSKRIAADLLT